MLETIIKRSVLTNDYLLDSKNSNRLGIKNLLFICKKYLLHTILKSALPPREVLEPEQGFDLLASPRFLFLLAPPPKSLPF